MKCSAELTNVSFIPLHIWTTDRKHQVFMHCFANCCHMRLPQLLCLIQTWRHKSFLLELSDIWMIKFFQNMNFFTSLWPRATTAIGYRRRTITESVPGFHSHVQREEDMSQVIMGKYATISNPITHFMVMHTAYARQHEGYRMKFKLSGRHIISCARPNTFMAVINISVRFLRGWFIVMKCVIIAMKQIMWRLNTNKAAFKCTENIAGRTKTWNLF